MRHMWELWLVLVPACGLLRPASSAQPVRAGAGAPVLCSSVVVVFEPAPVPVARAPGGMGARGRRFFRRCECADEMIATATHLSHMTSGQTDD